MLYKRDILQKIEKVLFRDEFLILSGARQTGKTSILLILKNLLEEKGFLCHYFNLENQQNLKFFNADPLNLLEAIPKEKSKQFIFIDEIQYLDNPSNFLKLLHDEYKNRVKIIASGSSSFYIDKKFRDSLVGRKFLFEIYPLNFDEFLVFKKEEKLFLEKGKLTLYYRKKLEKLWNEYLTFGGYPKVVLAEDEELKKILLEEIGYSYVKKDIVDAGIRNSEKYFSLLRLLADQAGQLVNSQELAATLGVAHKTVDEYLYVMRKSYQVAFISPFFRNMRKELVKMPKAYFYDLGLRNFFLGDYSSWKNRADREACLENIIFRELLKETRGVGKIKFWRTQDQKEVDFVVGKSAYEAKFNSRKQKEGKYAKFQEQYPDIKFSFISNDDLLERFYDFQDEQKSKDR